MEVLPALNENSLPKAFSHFSRIETMTPARRPERHLGTAYCGLVTCFYSAWVLAWRKYLYVCIFIYLFCFWLGSLLSFLSQRKHMRVSRSEWGVCGVHCHHRRGVGNDVGNCESEADFDPWRGSVGTPRSPFLLWHPRVCAFSPAPLWGNPAVLLRLRDVTWSE